MTALMRQKQRQLVDINIWKWYVYVAILDQQAFREYQSGENVIFSYFQLYF